MKGRVDSRAVMAAAALGMELRKGMGQAQKEKCGMRKREPGEERGGETARE